MVTVFATKAFDHDGHAVEVGDALQTSTVDALRLKGEGKVSLSFRSSRRLRASTPAGSGRQADKPSDRGTDVNDDAVTPAVVDAMDTAGTAHALSADNQSDLPRRRRGRRSYRRAEADVGETTELDSE